MEIAYEDKIRLKIKPADAATSTGETDNTKTTTI